MLLQVRDLRTYFDTEEGTVKAVDGISFDLNAGRTLGIVGESGCGKSVTAMSLLRLLPTPPARHASGEILFQGEDLLGKDPEAMRAVRGRELAVIFQEPMTSLNPVYTVGFQIAEAIQNHYPEKPADAVKERVLELLGRVGIADAANRFDSYPHQLSGGMRQRIMIAMALACDPKLLIADEPTTALDVTIQAQILELMTKLKTEMGMSVILITHDMGVIAEMVDEVIVMYAGKIVERAAVGELFARPLHPYSRGLLASIPSMQKRGERLNTIPGQVPPLTQLPKGCAFQDRCPLVKPHCREKDPVLESKSEGHWVSCFEVGAL
ncbi:MAG: ABC transporter ATP-binding protein [Bdellovibrionaceae bacterium]|nr:ABC transporter ATP-binding protein [Pseudobdellovibrionaceae bacterium]